MTNLKRLTGVIALTFVLALSTFAGNVQTSRCAPGDVQTPPCSAGQTVTSSDSKTPGDVNTPPASNAADIYSLAEVALNVLQSALSIF
jgi:hypothetical protein